MQDFLAFIGVACGAFLGVVAVAAWLWKFVIKPAKIKAEAAFDLIDYELNTNGGQSIKDRINAIGADAKQAVALASEAAKTAKETAEAIESHRGASRDALAAHLQQSMEEHAAIRASIEKVVVNTGGS